MTVKHPPALPHANPLNSLQTDLLHIVLGALNDTEQGLQYTPQQTNLALVWVTLYHHSGRVALISDQGDVAIGIQPVALLAVEELAAIASAHVVIRSEAARYLQCLMNRQTQGTDGRSFDVIDAVIDDLRLSLIEWFRRNPAPESQGSHVDDRLIAALRQKLTYAAIPTVGQNDIATLRRSLAIRTAGTGLYCDDGELQDNSMRPMIDFKRDPPGLIRRKLIERNRLTSESE